MAWRADCHTRDLVGFPSSLFIVGIVSLIQMAYFYPAHLFISLSTTFAPSQSITQLSVRMVCYCKFLFYAGRASSGLPSETSIVVMVSTSFCVHLVLCQMFFLFRRCNTCCRSYMGFGTHNRSCVCLPLYLSDALASMCQRFLCGLTADAIS